MVVPPDNDFLVMKFHFTDLTKHQSKCLNIHFSNANQGVDSNKLKFRVLDTYDSDN